MSYLNPDIAHAFEFLTRDFDFAGPLLWNIAYEQQTTYVKERVFVNIGYDGSFSFMIGKTHEVIPELATGHVHLTDIHDQRAEEYDISLLFPRERNIRMLLNGRSWDQLPQEEREEYRWIRRQYYEIYSIADLLKQHPEVLSGDFTCFHEAAKHLPGIFRTFIASFGRKPRRAT